MTKKELELHWLESARKIRPDLFGGEIESREAPDFLLVRDGRRLGVELTRYSNPNRDGEPIPEEQTGLRQKVMALARSQFAKRSESRLRVGVVFNPSQVLRAGRVRTIAEEIACHLLSHLDSAPEWSRLQWKPADDPHTPEIPEVSSVFASVVPSVANTHWYPAQAGWVSEADHNELTRIVHSKDAKVKLYRKACETVMLLIVFDGSPHWGRAMHAPVAPVSFSVATSFDLICCLDVLEKRLVVVPVGQLPR